MNLNENKLAEVMPPVDLAINKRRRSNMKAREAHNLLKQFKHGDIVDVTMRGVVVHNTVDEHYDTNTREENPFTNITVYLYDYRKPTTVDCVDMQSFDGKDARITSVKKVEAEGKVE